MLVKTTDDCCEICVTVLIFFCVTVPWKLLQLLLFFALLQKDCRHESETKESENGCKSTSFSEYDDDDYY